jgi:hypothetical protein
LYRELGSCKGARGLPQRCLVPRTAVCVRCKPGWSRSTALPRGSGRSRTSRTFRQDLADLRRTSRTFRLEATSPVAPPKVARAKKTEPSGRVRFFRRPDSSFPDGSHGTLLIRRMKTGRVHRTAFCKRGFPRRASDPLMMQLHAIPAYSCNGAQSTSTHFQR